MTTPNSTTTKPGSDTRSYRPTTTAPRAAATSETKPAYKTTEMMFYVVAVIAVLIATQVVEGFAARQGWLYVTILTVGYMLSRGIAKAGSYAKDEDPRTDAYPDGR